MMYIYNSYYIYNVYMVKVDAQDLCAQERFVHRAMEPFRVLAEIGRGNPRDESWLNHPGVTLKKPSNALPLHSKRLA